MSRMYKPLPEDEDDTFLRRFATPWEDIFARGLPSMRWYCPNRYFRSPNVVPLESYRQPGEWMRIIDAMRQREREREAATAKRLLSKSSRDTKPAA
jgi:hypothetical protein